MSVDTALTVGSRQLIDMALWLWELTKPVPKARPCTPTCNVILPVEVLENIAAHASGTAVLALSDTSRDFRRWVLPRLWHAVIIHDGGESAADVAEFAECYEAIPLKPLRRRPWSELPEYPMHILSNVKLIVALGSSQYRDSAFNLILPMAISQCKRPLSVVFRPRADRHGDLRPNMMLAARLWTSECDRLILHCRKDIWPRLGSILLQDYQPNIIIAFGGMQTLALSTRRMLKNFTAARSDPNVARQCTIVGGPKLFFEKPADHSTRRRRIHIRDPVEGLDRHHFEHFLPTLHTEEATLGAMTISYSDTTEPIRWTGCYRAAFTREGTDQIWDINVFSNDPERASVLFQIPASNATGQL